MCSLAHAISENAEGGELPKLGFGARGVASLASLAHQRACHHPAHTPNTHPGGGSKF